MLRRFVVGISSILVFARTSAGQAGNPGEAFDFLQPAGARAMAVGQAVVASTIGAEAVWWNPALIARIRSEFLTGAVSGTAIEGDINAVGVYTIPRVISVALSLRYMNQGRQDAGFDPISGETGSFNTSAYIFGGTFAAPFGSRLALGTTVKLLMFSFDCTGTCPNQPQNNPVTGAVDVGVQYFARKDSLFTIGAALRNVGSRLQFNDSPQADPLPVRVDAGVEFAPRFKEVPGLGLRAAASIVSRVVADEGPGFRFGAEASWLNSYFGRVGYVRHGPTGSGPSIGGGISRGRWRIDFAEFLSEETAGLGARPTYFSLRYLF